METQNFPNTNVPSGPLLPDNTPPFDPMADFFADARSPINDPSVAGDIASVIAKAVAPTTIAPYESELVQLPISVTIADQTIQAATVRELTGADEEELAKAAVSGEPERVLDTLLRCGVVSLGTHTPNSQDLLDLPVANRDALLIAIRKATYGIELKFAEIRCQRCAEDFELTYDLNDIPTKQGGTGYVSVALRRGGQVIMRLPTGADQMEILSQIRTRKINRAEQDTIFLARCLVERVAFDGNAVTITDSMQSARSLSMADRAEILKALEELRPGPRMEDASVTCPACERSTEVPLSIDYLFRN